MQSTVRKDQDFINYVQYSFLSKHMLEPTRVKNVLDIYLSSEKEYVENDKMCEPHFPECCQFTLISNT